MEFLFAFGAIGTLVWLGFWGLVIYGIWVFIRNSVPALRDIGPKDLSPLSIVLTFFLVIAVIFLFQQAWNDLGRLAGEQVRGRYSPDLELSRLLIRLLFVGPATFFALLLYFLLRGKGTKYGVLTLPYFITSLLFLIRLLFDAGRFVLNQYKVLGIYIVLIFIIVIISALIFFIQNQYESYKSLESKIQKKVKENEQDDPRKDSLPPTK